MFGWAEGRDPNSTFDTTAYLAANADVAVSGINPFEHFQLYGLTEGRAPNGSIPALSEFDATTYVSNNSDLSGLSDAEAYAHYIQYGQFEGRAAQDTNGDAITPLLNDGTNANPDDDNAGGTFTFTTTTGEMLTGTSADETFNAVVDAGGAQAGQTFSVGEMADGGNGVDTINLLATSASALIPGTITDIEIINLLRDAAADTISDGTGTFFDISTASGATTVNVLGGVVTDVYNVGATQTVGYKSGAVGDVTIDNGVTSANVVLENATSGGTLTVATETATDLATVTVSGSVAGAGALNIDLNAASNSGGTAASAETTLNLALTTNGTIGITSTTLTTLDASGSTGDLTAALTNAAALTTVSFGSGDDTVTQATNGAAATFDTGAGADALTLETTGVADTVVINEGDTGITAATSDNITNFTTTQDKMDFNLTAGDGTNFLDGGASSDYVDALTNANTAFDGTVQYFFSDDGTNGWLFVDRDLDGTADEGVIMTGVTAMVQTDIIA
jgi:hypothetical protein